MQARSLFVASVIGLSILGIAGFASAQQIYSWKDASGVVHFSQTPPSSGTHYTKMQVSSGSAVAARPSAPSGRAPSVEGGDAAVPPPAPAQSTRPDTPANRTALCKQLRSNIALLQGTKPVVTRGGDGKQQVMDDGARQRQLATARSQQVQYCSSMNR